MNNDLLGTRRQLTERDTDAVSARLLFDFAS